MTGLLEGRVVRFLGGDLLRSYPTAAEAGAAASAEEGEVIVLTAEKRAENEDYIARYG